MMQQTHLFTMIRDEFAQLLNGYVRHPQLTERLDEFIQPPQLGGALASSEPWLLLNKRWLPRPSARLLPLSGCPH